MGPFTKEDLSSLIDAIDAKYDADDLRTPSDVQLRANLVLMLAHEARAEESANRIPVRARDPVCRDDVGDGSTVYDDRPRPGAVSAG